MLNCFGFNFNIGFGNNFGCFGGMNNFFTPSFSFMPSMFCNSINNIFSGFSNPFFNQNFNFINNSVFNFPCNSTFVPSFNTGFDIFNSQFSPSGCNTFSAYSNISSNTNTDSTSSSSVSKQSSTEKSKSESISNSSKSSNVTKPKSTEKTKSKAKIKNTAENLSEYNADKGEKLVKTALKNKEPKSTRRCARYVKNAIKEAGLGEYKLGHAYQMPGILENNSNFKEIPVDNVDVSSLPAGCILVYDKGAKGFDKEYGHTEITTGDGDAVSDFLHRNVHKKPSAIFIPV